MSIDFQNKESRQEYLGNKLDDLLENINSSYGKTLLDELVTRLHRTIDDFNEEFQGIIGELKDSSERRNQILHDLMEGKNIPKGNIVSSDIGHVDASDSDHGDSSSGEMSAWEKKLEGLS